MLLRNHIIAFSLFFVFPVFAIRDFEKDYVQAANRVLKGCGTPAANRICKLTALHKAVLASDLKKIKALVKTQADLEVKAKHDWRPAHFAALHATRDVIELLYSLGAKKDSLDSNQGTPEDLWQRVHLTYQHQINIWDDETNSVGQINSNEFLALTRAEFVESIKLSPLTMADAWVTGFRKQADQGGEKSLQLPFYSQIKSSYQKMTQQDRVYLKSAGWNTGYGVYALEKFKAGDILGEYQGEWIGKLDKQDSEYSTQNINAKHLRGYMAFAAHGLPNAMLVILKNAAGLGYSEVLVATRDIEPHEAILWAYGGHDVIWDVYVEMNPEGLDGFVKIHGLVPDQSLPFDIESQGKHLSVTYALTTPTVFLRLLFENRISNDELKYIFRNLVPGLPDTWQKFYAVLQKAMPAMESHKAEIYPFLADKAREGNLQVLSVWMQYWNRGQATDLRSLQAFWEECWRVFCDYWKTSSEAMQGRKRGNCGALFENP